MTEPSLVALSAAVHTAAEARARRQQLAARLKVTQALVASRHEELATLENTLHVEQEDVRRLEHLSPTKIWAALRGNTEDRLSVERAEADAAALAVAAARKRLDSAMADDARVREEYDALRDADGAYARALAVYEVALQEAGSQHATDLAEIARELGVAEERQREITEAVDTLRGAIAALDRAQSTLSSAGGWSTYDTFFGGGLVTDMVKHSKINDATAAFADANRALERLSVELADLDVASVNGVEMSTTLGVFDVAFDNIISDWMVKDRISQAKASAEDIRRRLDTLGQELAARAQDNASRVSHLLERRESILTTA
ncbi:hypothetical protein [Demequina sp.]|uniref:hypothetical protein n=1 Tax=Demequina sp. TaxID=2050685 RepID=UPI003A887D05